MSNIKGKKYRRFSESFINKLDGMKMDNEYDPYAAVKKQNIDNNELFNNEVYINTDKISKSTSAINFIVFIILLVVLAGFICLIYNYLA